MGYFARVSAAPGGLTDDDAAQLAQVGPVWYVDPGAPIIGEVWRNGRAIPVTLQSGDGGRDMPRIMVEQVVMAALLLGSFLVPLFHPFG